MKKKNLLLIILIVGLFTMPKKVFAYSAYDYQDKLVCNNYELASFKEDGSVTKIECYDDFYIARNDMRNNGGADLAIMARYYNNVKILDANAAILDMTQNGDELTYFYDKFDLSGYSYTYIYGGSGYGGVDAAYINSAWGERAGWTVNLKMANYTGWVPMDVVEIVPLPWVKSLSSYTITNDSIRHNYVYKIQDYYYGSSGSTIGPKPEMLNTGTYYSYDGHYFYNNIYNMLMDYRNGNYNNSINKNSPYYNYYQYLSNHTKTTYSSTNIDEYIRNNLGYTRDVYGNAASDNTSRLYGKGLYFYNAQQKYGVNAILSLSLSRNETGNGRSNLAINKNNGFGLNAVDSNPYQAANWYASFAQSILGYASRWVTYGYAHPRDWRYYGPQFGDKYLGMNVKYASDAYWSEKMASNYYWFDKSKGLQDYNYYQLGIANRSFYTYSAPNYNSKQVYRYTEYGDSIVIVGYKDGWYEIVSDLNIDSNYNEITSGDYNWNQTVWAPASEVTLINTGKNGYISPNSVTDYLDSDYTYDLMVINTEYQPKVGYSLKNTNFYYDSTLQSITGQQLVKNRYVMIHGMAYDGTGKLVSYLVTSEYWHDQKHWVSADSITITNKAYGKALVTASGNQYTWVNYNLVESESTIISGLFTNTYVPVLEEAWADGRKWYKVPVDISGTTNEYGWTLADIDNVFIELHGSINADNFPVINAFDTSIVQGTDINLLDGVTATDVEDGTITNKVKVRSGSVNKDVVGTYQITYEVTDTTNLTTTKTITITVTKNEVPVINAEDIELKVNGTLVENATATDKEDGNITNSITKTKNTVDTTKAGTYEITYSVTDSYNQTTTKTIKVVVLGDEAPVITAEDKEVLINSEFNPLTGVTALDKEDGNLTSSITVKENNVDITKVGTYTVKYEVKDSFNNKTTKTINVKVVKEIDLTNYTEKDPLYAYESIKYKDNNIFEFAGFIAVKDMNNSTNDIVKHYIVFVNENTSEEYRYPVSNWTDSYPQDFNGFAYNYDSGWFKGNVDISNLPAGDYVIYAEVYTNNYKARYASSNTVYGSMPSRNTNNGRGYEFKNNEYSKTYSTNLLVRDNGLIETSTSKNKMFNVFEDMSFNNNTLNLVGMSYSSGMNLDALKTVSRQIIFENTETFDRYSYDIGSITNGRYPITLKVNDGLSKTRGWFDSNIDLSKLPKGTYSIYIKTKVDNISNYDELRDLTYAEFDSTNKYQIVRKNKNRMKLELIVK
ncbi:MAG: DUF5011 domain-containing protein [Bacilli bacterium]|nr:DUF5011 domain-containing protein [Bacilli bacterium]